MKSLELLDPTDLYNMLQQSTVYPCLSDANYLLLLDARKKHEYNESHVITAKKAPTGGNDAFLVPYDAELECKQTVVVYDSNTSSLSDTGPAIECAKTMWEMGSRGTVQILKGGYEQFSALYPFLRTQKILYLPREMDELKPFPSEIMPGFLYLGNWAQGNASDIQKDLKIKAHVNCCVEAETFFSDPCPELLHVQVTDDNEADILCKFESTCAFLESHREKNQPVLVFSCLGISRSAAVVIAYTMYHYKWTLKQAYDHAVKCCPTIRPNRGFIIQLQQWEKQILGRVSTDVRDPNF